MVTAFSIVTRTDVSPERLFDVSLNIDAHQASMASSGERAIAGVTSGAIGLARDADVTVMTDTLTLASPILGRLAERAILVSYLRRLIWERNRHLLASCGPASATPRARETTP